MLRVDIDGAAAKHQEIIKFEGLIPFERCGGFFFFSSQRSDTCRCLVARSNTFYLFDFRRHRRHCRTAVAPLPHHYRTVPAPSIWNRDLRFTTGTAASHSFIPSEILWTTQILVSGLCSMELSTGLTPSIQLYISLPSNLL